MRFKKEKNSLTAAAGCLGVFLCAYGIQRVLIDNPQGQMAWERDTWLMIGELILVFLWNYAGLSGRSRESGKSLRTGIVLAGNLLFLWCHRALVPMAAAGVWIFTLSELGTVWNRRLIGAEAFDKPEERMLGLVSGSGLWIIIVCLVSLLGYGGVRLWRAAALILVIFALALCLRRGRNPGSIEGYLPQNRQECALFAFLVTMVFLQAGRLNISLDYDSLHYALRSPFVLDNGRGIYENLGMVNLVYTYSKGLEVLALPLSGTNTYGFVLAFTLWTTIGTLLVAARIGFTAGGRTGAFWSAALLAAIPGIMNMGASAKSDSITLLHQLIIYHFLVMGLKETGETRRPWLLMAVSAYLLTLGYKPTALVFSTALGGVGLLCYLPLGKRMFEGRGGLRLQVLPALAAAGLWYRTWRITGVPVTSIFASFCERLGMEVRYPFTFTHVIGDPTALTAAEKAARLKSRLAGMFLAPVGEDMAHVIIAWGTGLVTFLLLLWLAWTFFRRNFFQRAREAWFDCILILVLCLGSAASIYTLSQVDGNYFILLYSLLAVGTVRLAAEKGAWNRLRIWIAPFFLCSLLITASTSWAGAAGMTKPKLLHKGYYDHQEERAKAWEQKGYYQLASRLQPRNRVLAFGTHPEVLDLPCCVQSYYDVTGNGGNVYLVKKLDYFKEFLKYAGTEYFLIEADYLEKNPRANEIVQYMIEDGSLTDLVCEWGNILGRVEL